MGGELTICFDNCTGQNKNNTVMKLMVWLCEMGYFKKISFIFLVVGHTKNSCDRHFNLQKKGYRKGNIFVMDELLTVLDESPYVTVHEAKEEDFFDWDEYLSLFYSDFVKKIKQNHIFSCTHGAYDKNKTKLIVDLRKSDLPEHEIVQHNAIKRGFFGRFDFPEGKKTKLQVAVAARPLIMRRALKEKLKIIECPGLNIYKQLELYKHYKPIIPQEWWGDWMYQKPTQAVIKAVAKETRERAVFRGKLKDMKLEVGREAKFERKNEIKSKVEAASEYLI